MSQSAVKQFTEDEIAVTEILLALRKLISLSDYLTDFNWGSKRRRSCLDDEYQIEETKAIATASPTTPLSFSPTESDENSTHKKTSNLRKDNIERLTQTRDVLRREVENAKKHYHKLKAYNSELKAMKQEVMNKFSIRKEEPQLGRTQDNRITDPTAQQIFHIPIGSRLYNSSNAEAPTAGPLGIDLNIPAIEAYYEEPLDASMAIADQRARSAEARRLRRGLMKAKSMRNNNAVLKICQQPDDYENGVF